MKMQYGLHLLRFQSEFQNLLHIFQRTLCIRPTFIFKYHVAINLDRGAVLVRGVGEQSSPLV